MRGALDNLIESSIREVIAAASSLCRLTPSGDLRGATPELLARVEPLLTSIAAHSAILNSVGQVNHKVAIEIVATKFGTMYDHLNKSIN